MIRTRLSKGGSVLDTLELPDDPMLGMTMLKESMENGEQCEIRGKIPLYKVKSGMFKNYLGYRTNVVLI